jgi:hypothetical protein
MAGLGRMSGLEVAPRRFALPSLRLLLPLTSVRLDRGRRPHSLQELGFTVHRESLDLAADVAGLERAFVRFD